MDTHVPTTTTRSPEETEALAARIVETLARTPGTRGTSTIVALKGDLGAGKTVFVKGAAKALGVTGVVTSPTFVIEKVYKLPDGASWRHLVHIDAYRLEDPEEIRTIGWDDVATDPGNLIMIEWPEQLGLAVPERAVWIEIEQVDETKRRFSIRGLDTDEQSADIRHTAA